VQVEILAQNYRDKVNHRLEHILASSVSGSQPLHEAMRYSCLTPGKRLRPLLCLASAEACGADPLVALDTACAVEMVHCFSMIHDDLPAIDNDDLRRGLPTCHKMFGEAVALLAGDALFALAFEVLSRAHSDTYVVCKLVETLSRASGSHGLAGGEVLDILSEGKEPTLEVLEKIHKGKTGALITASCVMGGLCAGASASLLENLELYGGSMGLAFQIMDDVLNETGSKERLGKATGSDRERGKVTYPALMGVQAAKETASRAVEEALGVLECFPGENALLRYLAEYNIVRVH
jgi:geranylgeranyl diphosphate synthase type II